MMFSLDTPTFLWWLDDPMLLSEADRIVREARKAAGGKPKEEGR